MSMDWCPEIIDVCSDWKEALILQKTKVIESMSKTGDPLLPPVVSSYLQIGEQS